MSSKVSKSERTRQFIVEQSAPVFNAKGYAGTSLTDLINATSLTKGSIYGNFDNKDEVAIAAFDFNFNRVTAYIKERILTKDNAIEQLLVYPTVYREFLKIPFLKQGCPLLNTSTEADDTHPALKERALNAFIFWKTSVENIIKKGVQRKEIKADINPSEIAAILISLIEGAIMTAKLTEKSADLKITMNFLEKLILDLKT